jgi:hypothetical protein
MKCVNCGHENPDRALICYWCGVEPTTGELPYRALGSPAGSFWEGLAVPEVTLPPAIELPAPMPVPEFGFGTAGAELLDLTVPEVPPIEIAPPPDIPDQTQFVAARRRPRLWPVVRISAAGPPVLHPLLPFLGRLLVFVGGLALLLVLGLVLVAAIGAASFGAAFCLVGMLGLAAVLWVGLLAVRAGKRIVEETGEIYERLEVWGRVLREVVPGVVEELPVNLPAKTGVLDQPVAYSELRALASQGGEASKELAQDMLTGAIASLVARDDVILARRTYPVEVRGRLTQSTTNEVTHPVLTRRRLYVGPGVLEEQINETLRTDRSMTVEELVKALAGPDGRERAQQVISAVNEALSERPPDLDALASPEEALAEFQRYREAVRRADPELYQLLEEEVRRGLAAVMRRPVPSSLSDLVRYASVVVDNSSPPRS